MKRYKRTLFWIILVFSSTLLSHGKPTGQGDEPHYLMIAHSLWFDHDLELSNDYADKANLISGGNLKAEKHLIKGKNGYYSIHSFGLPLIFLPVFGIAYEISDFLPAPTLASVRLTKWTFLRLLIVFPLIVLTAIFAGQIFEYLSNRFDPKVSFATVLICFLSIPLLPLGFLFFPEMIASFLSFTAFRFIRAEQTSWHQTIATGLCLAYLPLLHVKYYLLALLLFGLMIYRFSLARDQRKRIIYISAIFIFGQFILAWVNYHSYGTILPFAGYGNKPLHFSFLTRGLLGLFLDQEFGLLWFSPVYVLVPVGFALFFKEEKSTSLEYLVLASSIILVCGAWPMWWGGWSPASRFLTPAVVFLIPFLTRAISAMRKSGGFLWLLCVFILVFQLALAVTFWFNPKLMWNQATGQSYFHSKLIDGCTSLLPSIIIYTKRDMLLAFLWLAAFSIIDALVLRSIRKRQFVKL